VLGTRQTFTVGKGGRRDGGHLPSAFAECPAVWHSAKGFSILFFKKILCRVSCDLALDKGFLPSVKVGTWQFFFVFLPHFFLGPCYNN
jgi:hypothetical protein